METKPPLDAESLPTTSPTAEIPKRKLSLGRRVAIFISGTLIYCYLLTAFSIVFLFLTSLANVLVGVTFVGAFEAVLQRSWGDLIDLFRLSTYWPFLKTSWIGGAVVSVIICPVLCTGYCLYKAYQKEFPMETFRIQRLRVRQEHAALKGKRISPMLALLGVVVAKMLSVAAVPAAVLANQLWWQDEAVASVGENLIRSMVIVLAGGVINNAHWLYQLSEEAKKAKIELTGVDEVPLVRKEPV